jgi:endonuclease/exonuclease/phosphatase family metal-dependent hydrolase
MADREALARSRHADATHRATDPRRNPSVLDGVSSSVDNHRIQTPRKRTLGAPIRILTANLFSGRADPSALVDLVEALEADVVCVQELGPRLAGPLSRVRPGGHLGPNDFDRGLGIACRHDAEVRQIPLPKRDGWVARLSPTSWPQIAEPIEIVNVHIMAPHTYPYFPRTHTRKGQLAALLRFLDMDRNVPRAILGDFNASPIWPVYRRMAERLTDSVVAHGRGGSGAKPTWPHLPAIGLRGLFRIDHCFLSKLDVRDVQVVSVPGSDHLALCVDVSMPAEPDRQARPDPSDPKSQPE